MGYHSLTLRVRWKFHIFHWRSTCYKKPLPHTESDGNSVYLDIREVLVTGNLNHSLTLRDTGLARIFENFQKNLLRKFFKKFNKEFVTFFHVWTKNNLWENFWKISKDFSGKLRKYVILAYFSKYLTNHTLILCAFGLIVGEFWENFENLWWKFYRKLNFYFIFIFENLLLKI